LQQSSHTHQRHWQRLCDQGSIILVPRLPPAFCRILYQTTGREPGQFHHVCETYYAWFIAWFWVIELSPTHAIVKCLNVLETELPYWLFPARLST